MSILWLYEICNFLTWVWPPPPFFWTMFKNCKISEEGHSLLRLVEVLGYLARLERVHCAEDDEDHVVEEGHDDREGRNLGRMVFRLCIKIQRMKYCVLMKIEEAAEIDLCSRITLQNLRKDENNLYYKRVDKIREEGLRNGNGWMLTQLLPSRFQAHEEAAQRGRCRLSDQELEHQQNDSKKMFIATFKPTWLEAWQF